MDDVILSKVFDLIEKDNQQEDEIRELQKAFNDLVRQLNQAQAQAQAQPKE